jgi:bisphosphoglycerate-dependent phosphoglycerate mutase
MSGKAIFSIIMIVFWSIMAAWATSNLFAPYEDVKIAEQDVEKAKAEYEQAQREVDAIIDDHLARAGQ